MEMAIVLCMWPGINILLERSCIQLNRQNPLLALGIAGGQSDGYYGRFFFWMLCYSSDIKNDLVDYSVKVVIPQVQLAGDYFVTMPIRFGEQNAEID